MAKLQRRKEKKKEKMNKKRHSDASTKHSKNQSSKHFLFGLHIELQKMLTENTNKKKSKTQHSHAIKRQKSIYFLPKKSKRFLFKPLKIKFHHTMIRPPNIFSFQPSLHFTSPYKYFYQTNPKAPGGVSI
eukprot:TRINITY_DN17750_c0_g1_i2.p1 TRINITY_DN17750_c0_g1~~TRINITY_DN17750_c0_g1_i2.p1  ORF type:complete len:130 (-),score=11.15 TRINITY_DN17750_c0_g1_i2:38-427(-)